MAEEPDKLVLQPLRSMRAENAERFDAIEAALTDVRLTVVGHDLRFHGLEERVETIREGAVTAIGYAARGGPMTRARFDGVAVTDWLAYCRAGHGAKGA